MASSTKSVVNIAKRPNLRSQLAPEAQANFDITHILCPEGKRQLTKEQKTLADTQESYDIMAQQGAQELYLDVKVSGIYAENRTCVIISPLNQKPTSWIEEILKKATLPTSRTYNRPSKARVKKTFVV